MAAMASRVTLLNAEGVEFALTIEGGAAEHVASWLNSEAGRQLRGKLREAALQALELSAAGGDSETRSETSQESEAGSFAILGSEAGSSAPTTVGGVPVAGVPVAGVPVDGEGFDPQAPVVPHRGVSLERRLRAYCAGQSAGRKLRGESEVVDQTPAIEGIPPPRFRVVLRGVDGQSGLYTRWYRHGRFPGAEDVVHEDTEIGRTLAHNAVFHSWPSATEVADYCRGAGVAVPERVG